MQDHSNKMIQEVGGGGVAKKGIERIRWGKEDVVKTVS